MSQISVLKKVHISLANLGPPGLVERDTEAGKTHR